MSTRKNRRNEDGASLIAVLSLVLTGTLIITALFSAVLPTVRGVSKTKVDNALREAAESGLDFVVAKLAAGGQEAKAYEPTEAGASCTTTLAASGTQGSPLGDFAGIPITATCTVSDIACPQNSYLYAFELDPANSGSAAQVSASGNRWRTVTVSATVAGLNKQTRILRAVLRPIYTSVPSTSTVTSTSTTEGWPFRAIAASGNFTGSGGITTNSYNSVTDGSDPTSFRNIYGDVMANGNASCNASSGSIGGDLAAAGNAEQGQTTVSGQVIDGAEALKFPPVPSHPESAKALTPTDLYVKNGASKTLTTGDYYVTADSKGNAINILGSLNISGTVRIWVEGTSPSVTIKGLANSGNPANFQLFYNPANPSTTETAKGSSALINIGGNGEFRGVIYAPNADIDVSGASNYYGSIVGNDVQLTGGGSGGAFHYDEALKNTSILQWNQTTTTSTGSNSSSYAACKCVSWQEL